MDIRPAPRAACRAPFRAAAATALAAAACLGAGAKADDAQVAFEDKAAAWGLTRALKGMMAHAAACGDVDGDGDLDLYVGTYCDRPPERYKGRDGPLPNLLLLNDGGRYRDAAQPAVVMKARTSGAVFADLDNDGDLDLYVSNNSKRSGLRLANKLFENVGGRFREAPDAGAAAEIMGGRSISVLDYDGDALLDLLVAEDQWTGRRTRLLRNRGRLRFEDVSAKVHLPAELPGLGVVTPDLNGDGRPDLFVAQANRLFLSTPKGIYREGGSKALQYPPINREASPCGVSFGDLDRDGDLDLVIVDHSQPAHQHVFLNDGLAGGVPRFREATRALHLAYDFPSWTPDKFHLKHAHVEVGDFDNDGWPDILVAATWTDGGRTQPFLCRNLGRRGGKLRFDVPPVSKADTHYAAGPAGDFDRDGRLDIFLAPWLPERPARLFLNRSPKRRWLRVRVVGRPDRGVSRMGIGAKVRVYAAGRLGQPDALLGYQEIAIGLGFCSGQEAVAHFGLADAAACDVEVTLPHGRGTIRRRGVKADQVVVIRQP